MNTSRNEVILHDLFWKTVQRIRRKIKKVTKGKRIKRKKVKILKQQNKKQEEVIHNLDIGVRIDI